MYVCLCLKIDKYEEDNYGQIYFNKFSGYQFIEIIGIDRCIGFFKRYKDKLYCKLYFMNFFFKIYCTVQ